MNENKVVKCWKGFDSNLKCLGFQYEVGKTYEIDNEESVELCKTGFHAVPETMSPLKVFKYYCPSCSRYCEVEISGKIIEGDDKIVGSRITIVREIGIQGIVSAHEEWVKKNAEEGCKEKKQHCVVDYSSSSNTGYYSSSSNTGNCSSSSNTGDRSSSSNTGKYSSSSNTGNFSSSSNTGKYSSSSNTGDYSSSSNTGNCSSSSNTGNYSSSSNTGYRSSAEVSGKDSVAVVTGKDGIARGSLGCALFLTERNEDYEIVAVKAVIVDGKKVKANTWYKLVNGELTEV